LNMTAARLSPGAISVSSSSHLPPSVASKLAVVAHVCKDDRDRLRLPLEGNGRRDIA
jgi:hypothetical protein